MRCFYCENLQVGVLPENEIPEREKHHFFKVLRGKETSEILLIDGKGSIAKAVIENNKIIRITEANLLPMPEKKIHLFVAPPRKNQMDLLLKQCAEVGVWSITPIITERSISKPEKDSAIERMKILLIEGCKQSHNPFLPKLNPVKKLNDIHKNINSLDYAFFGSTTNCLKSEKIQHDRHKQLSGNIAWIVGPEGGFSYQETELLKSQGAQPLQLGNWIMRIETAAISGSVWLAN